MSELMNGSEEARGTFLYKGFRLQISKYKASGAERTSRLYHKRRKLGLCIRCGAKVTDKNPRSGKLYRLCEYHRDIIDRKESGSEKTLTIARKTGTTKSTSAKTRKTAKTSGTTKKAKKTGSAKPKKTAGKSSLAKKSKSVRTVKKGKK